MKHVLLRCSLFSILMAWGCGPDSTPTDAGPEAQVEAGPAECNETFDFAIAGEGHPDPLGSSATEARAGRIRGDQLPFRDGGRLTWQDQDWVIANDRIAVVIEDVGPSDLYDPWGGKPVGMGLMQDGQMVSPADFGELFFLVEAHTLFTQSVGVVNDGSDGGAAVIRAAGRLESMPFINQITSALFRNDLRDIQFAIDYVLEPGAEKVDVYFQYGSTRAIDLTLRTQLYGFMYTYRMPSWAPGYGYALEGEGVPWIAFVDREGASYAYVTPDTPLGGGLEASGFQGRFGEQIYTIPGCREFRRQHLSLVIAGPGLDGVVAAMAREEEREVRTLSGRVDRTDGSPAVGARVHATDMEGGHITESTVSDDGSYSLTLPAGEAAQVAVFDEGTVRLAAQTVNPETATLDLMLPPVSRLRISAFSTESMERVPVPARIQVRPVGESMIGVPAEFGEESPANSRLHNLLEVDGAADVVVPPGRWEVIVSRGYEYELFSTEVEVSVGAGPIDIVADLVRSVPTPGMLCADFHIHTRRSNDSGDDARYKVAGALADGLEIPVRSDHEYVGDFQDLIEEVSMEQWAYGMPSVELTTMQVYGHFGVIPAVAVDGVINAGSPVWQRYPTIESPNQVVENIMPPELFAQVRARPEAPAIIINHPRGATNYFGAAGFDSETGEVSRPEYWDTEFQAVEVFNDSGWLSNREGTVKDWLALLNTGRRVFAVGSSDSHNQRTSPVGYPRTCLELGTDSPLEATAEAVRDAMKEGYSTISGGIYVYTRVGDVGPGRDAVGLGATATVNVQVYAASWVDVDSLELIVDGETIMTVPVPDAPAESTLRLDQDFEVNVSEAGSYAIAAAYGDASLAPVHPGRAAFGAANPIFLNR